MTLNIIGRQHGFKNYSLAQTMISEKLQKKTLEIQCEKLRVLDEKTKRAQKAGKILTTLSFPVLLFCDFVPRSLLFPSPVNE